MVLLIDTSSACSAVAVTDAGGDLKGEVVTESGPTFDLPTAVRDLVNPLEITRIGVATGPGSFTGLRVGVAFALGLAISLRVPLHGLPTLDIARRRARVESTGVSEAGRGRIHYLSPDGRGGLADAHAIARTWPLAGWLRPGTAAALEQAGLSLLPESELRPFGEAAFAVFEGAPELAYGRVRLEYMQPEERGA